MPTLVSLSSGEQFYVDADPKQVCDGLNTRRLARLGGRFVNGGQVAQLQEVREIPSIHLPGEQLNNNDEGAENAD